MRCDIMMARKEYRDAVDCFKAGAGTSAIMANKTGIAYHQLGIRRIWTTPQIL